MPGGSGDVTRTHLAWESPRGSPFVPSPILYGEQLYMVNDMASIVTSLHATTGKTMFQGRLGVATREAAVVATICDNVWLEPSWCSALDVAGLIESCGVERILFGSDAPANLGLELARFRALNLDDAALAHGFVEMRPFLGHCKFGLDCRHDTEPVCAIRQAVTQGRISPRRYHSFQRLMAESGSQP